MASGILMNDGIKRRFFWNVDAHVGPGCPNRPDDVQLVQFAYYCMAQTPNGLAPFTPAEKAGIQAVVPGAQYTGAPTDPLTIAIKAHQRIRRGTQDGKVSPIQSASGHYGGTMTWMVIPLNRNIMMLHGAHWPLLHRMPKCPPDLAQVSRNCFDPPPA